MESVLSAFLSLAKGFSLFGNVNHFYCRCLCGKLIRTRSIGGKERKKEAEEEEQTFATILLNCD